MKFMKTKKKLSYYIFFNFIIIEYQFLHDLQEVFNLEKPGLKLTSSKIKNFVDVVDAAWNSTSGLLISIFLVKFIFNFCLFTLNVYNR